MPLDNISLWRQEVYSPSRSQCSARSPLLVFIRTMSTESDETTVATDVAEAGGSSGMSRLESQKMSQRFEEPHARRRISGCRQEKKLKEHEAGDRNELD